MSRSLRRERNLSKRLRIEKKVCNSLMLIGRVLHGNSWKVMFLKEEIPKEKRAFGDVYCLYGAYPFLICGLETDFASKSLGIYGVRSYIPIA